MTDEELNKRFDALTELISQGFARIDERFDQLNAHVDALLARMDRHAALWEKHLRQLERRNGEKH